MGWIWAGYMLACMLAGRMMFVRNDTPLCPYYAEQLDRHAVPLREIVPAPRSVAASRSIARSTVGAPGTATTWEWIVRVISPPSSRRKTPRTQKGTAGGSSLTPVSLRSRICGDGGAVMFAVPRSISRTDWKVAIAAGAKSGGRRPMQKGEDALLGEGAGRAAPGEAGELFDGIEAGAEPGDAGDLLAGCDFVGGVEEASGDGVVGRDGRGHRTGNLPVGVERSDVRRRIPNGEAADMRHIPSAAMRSPSIEETPALVPLPPSYRQRIVFRITGNGSTEGEVPALLSTPRRRCAVRGADHAADWTLACPCIAAAVYIPRPRAQGD
jgi:hypothetical protein